MNELVITEVFAGYAASAGVPASAVDAVTAGADKVNPTEAIAAMVSMAAMSTDECVAGLLAVFAEPGQAVPKAQLLQLVHEVRYERPLLVREIAQRRPVLHARARNRDKQQQAQQRPGAAAARCTNECSAAARLLRKRRGSHVCAQRSVAVPSPARLHFYCSNTHLG